MTSLQKQAAPKLSMRAKMTYFAHLFKALTRQHHTELLPILTPLLNTESTILDVGAHAGQFSKLFAKISPQGSIYAFEPASYTRSILQKVVNIHGLSNVKIIHDGLSDQKHTQTLHIPLKSSGSLGYGLSHLGDHTTDDRETYQEDINLITLDDFVQHEKIEKVDFIKADIEGWEMRMLMGAQETLKKHRPVLLLEMDDRFLERAGDSIKGMWQFLIDNDYKIEQIKWHDGETTRTPVSEPCQGDMLCIPAEKVITTD